MKYPFCILLLLCFTIYSQQKPMEHTVKQGESIYKIAKQYNVKPSEILELNPESKYSLKINSILKIPTLENNSKTESIEIVHQVLPKETLYSISKQHNVSIEEIFKVNPKLEENGLKISQIIKIPSTIKSIQKDNFKISEVEKIPDEGIIYEVLSKETKYTIAKKYGISEVLLDFVNPILKTEGLKAGQKILIPVKEFKATQQENKIDDKISNSLKVSESPIDEKGVKCQNIKSVDNHNSISIIKEVDSQDTKWGIAKEYGVSVADLEEANSFLRNKDLKVGQKLTIPNSRKLPDTLLNIENMDFSVNHKTIDNNINIEEIKTHIVLPKETKYGIAKEFGISVTELEKQNPKIANKLLIGETVSIKTLKTASLQQTKQDVIVEENFKSNSVVRDANFIDQLISTASENIGVRYRSGGITKDGFDCSGLMCSTFNTFDIQLPRTSFEQSQLGFIVDKENAQKGDLIFFKTSSRGVINHVGMVIEVADGDVKFIHASSSGVIISSVKEKYYTKRLVQINRVL